MRFGALTLVVTNDCNFDCRYCYKGKDPGRMPAVIAEESVDFFLPRARKEFFLNFYGGEPLLAFDLIRDAVERTRFRARKTGRRPRFALTTNGSLLSEDILTFLASNRFFLTLSYDGTAQDTQRAPGSRTLLRERIRRILKDKRLRLEVNAVFSPKTVFSLASTVRELDALGVSRFRTNLDSAEPWSPQARRRLKSELRKVGQWAGKRHRRGKPVPLINLQEEFSGRIRSCPAAKDRLAVDVEGKVWGCVLFSDYARRTTESRVGERFCFGSIRRIATRPEAWDGRYARIFANYAGLGADGLRTSSGSCFLCSLQAFCLVCPINAALSGGRVGLIPDHLCLLQKAQIAAWRLASPGSSAG